MSDAPRPTSALGTIPVWQKVLLLLAVILMCVGVGLRVTGALQPTPPPRQSTPALQAESLVPGEPRVATTPQQPPEEANRLDPWSPAIFRLGFSFFLGFAVAFALRMFVRLTIVTLGFFFLALFGLQYAGFIEVNWGAISQRYDSIAAWAASEFESFNRFLSGYIPSLGAAAAGAGLGFLRKV